MLRIGAGISPTHMLASSGSALAYTAAYAANSIDPQLVADFASGFYAQDGAASDFSTLFAATTEATSLGTMVDSDGLLKWRPHNLLTYSEDFTNAAWEVTDVNNTRTANQGVAPDGTLTADRLTSSSASQWLFRCSTTLVATDHTFEVWVRSNTGVDQNFGLYMAGSGNPVGSYVATSEWQKFTLSGTITTTSSGFGFYQGTSGQLVDLLIWGAHAYRSDLGGMALAPNGTTYVPTTTAARYLPRLGHHKWNGSAWVNKGVLVETEARTNLITQSNDFSTGWGVFSPDSLTRTANQGVGPDGDTSLDLIEITDTTNEDHSFFADAATVTDGSTYTISAFFRDDGQRYVSLRAYRSDNNWSVAVFDLQDMAVTQESNGHASGTIVSANIENWSGGLYRVSFSSSQTGNSLFTAFDFCNSGTPSLKSNNGVVSYAGVAGTGLYAGFFQLEAGSTPSSYIPTSGATATRAADTNGLTIAAALMPDYQTPNVIGPELVTNGTFDTDTTGWIAAEGSISVVSGELQLEVTVDGTAARAYTSFPTTVGRVYKVTASGVRRKFITSSNNLVGTLVSDVGPGASDWEAVFVADATTTYFHSVTPSNTLGSTATIDNISVVEIDPLAVSIAVKGEMTRADTGGTDSRFVNWQSGSRYIRTEASGVIGTGRFEFSQHSGTEFDAVYGPITLATGVNVPLNVASRHGSTFINGANDSTALTADTTPTAIADLSAANFKLGQDFMGTIEQLVVWPVDIGDTGIEEASA